jgi:D-Tyr-tRNAtyr deacylase
LWIAQTIRWAQGDLDDEELRVAVDRGLLLLLLGVAEGDARTELRRLLKELPQTSTPEDRHMKGVA